MAGSVVAVTQAPWTMRTRRAHAWGITVPLRNPASWVSHHQVPLALGHVARNSSNALGHASRAGNTTEVAPVVAFQRGTLSASGSNGTTLDTVASINDPTNDSNPISGIQSWTLDQLGNFSSVTSDGNGDTRTHNSQNELTATSAGALGYDNNGNLTTQTGQTTNTWDAWNRATTIRGTGYSYDALGRRIHEDASGGRTFLHSGWQVVETRLGSSSSAYEQFVYSLAYVDAVVLRDRDSDSNSGTGSYGASSSGLDERLYYQQDREFNVTALLSSGGTVVERMAYDPYGSVSFFDSSWGSRSSSSYANEVGFTGRWLDGTGMWYFRARYYEPVLGRFINRNPLRHGDGMNSYLGTMGLKGWIDPTGMPGDDPEEATVTIWLPGDPQHPDYDNNSLDQGIDLEDKSAVEISEIREKILERIKSIKKIAGEKGAKVTIRIYGHGQTLPDDDKKIWVHGLKVTDMSIGGNEIDLSNSSELFTGLKDLGVVTIYIRACSRGIELLDAKEQDAMDRWTKDLYDGIAKASGAHVKGFLGPDTGRLEAGKAEQRQGFYDTDGDPDKATSSVPAAEGAAQAGTGR